MPMLDVTPTPAPEIVAKMAVNRPPAYVTFHRVLPFVAVPEASGSFSYMGASDASGKSATKNYVHGEGTINEYQVGTKTASYTVDSYLARTFITFDEEKNYKDVINLKNAGGNLLARVFFTDAEKAFVSYLTAAKPTATATTDDTVIESIQEAVDAVADFGDAVIVITQKALRNLRKNPAVREYMVNCGKVSGNLAMVLGTAQAFREALADALEIKEVIVASSSVWGSAHDAELFVTAVQRDTLGTNNDFVATAKAMPCAGVMIYRAQQYPGADPLAPFQVTCWANPDERVDRFEAEGNFVIKCLDTNAIKRIALPAETQQATAETQQAS